MTRSNAARPQNDQAYSTPKDAENEAGSGLAQASSNIWTGEDTFLLFCLESSTRWCGCALVLTTRCFLFWPQHNVENTAFVSRGTSFLCFELNN
jgi:hypothetical protein